MHSFAYEIYIAATFNKSNQPTKNIHSSPSTPTQGTYREKMESEIKFRRRKRKRKKGELQNHNQIPILSYHAKPSFPPGFIIDGSQNVLDQCNLAVN